MANVFISHRTSDASQAESLSVALRKAGHRVWLDVWEIAVGDSIIAQMNSGLTGATYLVLCCGSSGIMSPWMSREWMSALARQLQGYGIKILPVRLAGGSIPAILADLKYADLSKDWTSGLAELLRAFR